MANVSVYFPALTIIGAKSIVGASSLFLYSGRLGEPVVLGLPAIPSPLIVLPCSDEHDQ